MKSFWISHFTTIKTKGRSFYEEIRDVLCYGRLSPDEFLMVVILWKKAAGIIPNVYVLVH